MAHSVIITTPMPTWKETVERYGLSKADQKFVISLVDEKIARQPAIYTLKTRNSASGSAKNETKKASGIARKTKSRVRKTA